MKSAQDLVTQNVHLQKQQAFSIPLIKMNKIILEN